MKWYRALPLIFFFLDACVDPLDIKLPAFPPRLVVDGLLSNDPGPYQVQLFYSSEVNTDTDKSSVETGATVWIIDENNVSEGLQEVSPGIYQTTSQNFHGEIGKQYRLKITTADDVEYQSEPQTLMSEGELDNVYVGFEGNGMAATGPEAAGGALNIYVDAHGQAGEQNLFRWRWKGVYQALSFPELHTINTPQTTIPDPLPCSGYVYDGILRKIHECECCDCWPYEFNKATVVSDNRLVSNSVFQKVNIGKIPVNGMRFHVRYHLTVEQLSVSEVEYEFWKLIKVQQESAGDLFQPNAIKVKGNMKCITRPEREVLGFFSVSAIKRQSIIILSEDIPAPIPALDSVAIECWKAFPISTIEKPPFW
jgi:hypothetical protein